MIPRTPASSSTPSPKPTRKRSWTARRAVASRTSSAFRKVYNEAGAELKTKRDVLSKLMKDMKTTELESYKIEHEILLRPR